MEAKNFEWEVKALDDLDGEALERVADFFNEHFPGVFYPKCTPEIFRWKLGSDNPAGRGFLTVALNNGRVVGTASGTRRQLLNDGRIVQGMEVGDTFTHPDFRKQGRPTTLYRGDSSPDDYFNKSIFGRLVSETLDRAAKTGVKYVFGTPNENSRPPYLSRLGFREDGWGKLRSWQSPAASFASNSRYKPFIKIALGIIFFARKCLGLFVLRGISIEEDLPTSIVFNEKVHSSTMESLTMNQDSAFLKHRYVNHPTYKYNYYKVQKNGLVLGWLITVTLVRSSGRRTLVLSDWVSNQREFVTKVPALISAIASHYPEIEVISAWMQNGSVPSLNWALFGFASRHEVSLIQKELSADAAVVPLTFGNFRFGWSDNG